MPFVLDAIAETLVEPTGLDRDSICFVLMLPVCTILSAGIRLIKDPWTRHLYSGLTGLIVMIEMYGEHTIILPLTMILGSYLLMLLVPRHQANYWVIFYIAVHFSSQSIWKILNNYEQMRDFVIPSMILVQKLWRLSC
jgi:hypothetical protein